MLVIKFISKLFSQDYPGAIVRGSEKPRNVLQIFLRAVYTNLSFCSLIFSSNAQEILWLI